MSWGDVQFENKLCNYVSVNILQAWNLWEYVEAANIVRC